MSFEPFSTNSAGPVFWNGSEGFGAPPPLPRVKSARSRTARQRGTRPKPHRLLSHGAGPHRGRARLCRAALRQALEEGPDFINYRAKSPFQAAPKLGIDRNAYARILNALEMIERGTYRNCREKGKQGVPRTVARVLNALLNLALQYGEVRPSLDGIARLACVCKQTVVNCLKLLEFYGFVIVHRRIKRIRTALGFKVVQDTNAYTIQEPQGTRRAGGQHL